MFERFSDEARRTVVRALVEARLLGHDYVGTEHVLIALASAVGTGPALATEGVPAERARVAVADVVTPESASTSWDDGPYTARARHTFELGVREAFGFDHHYVTNGHLLLGLLRLGQGNGMRALESLGVDVVGLRHKVAAGIETDGPPQPPPERRPLSTGHRLSIQQRSDDEVDLRDDPRSTVVVDDGEGGGSVDHADEVDPVDQIDHADRVGRPAQNGAAVGPQAGAAGQNGTAARVLQGCSFCDAPLGHGDRFIAGATARICVDCVQASARLLGVMETLRQDFTLVFDGERRTATLSVGTSPPGG